MSVGRERGACPVKKMMREQAQSIRWRYGGQLLGCPLSPFWCVLRISNAHRTLFAWSSAFGLMISTVIDC